MKERLFMLSTFSGGLSQYLINLWDYFVVLGYKYKYKYIIQFNPKKKNEIFIVYFIRNTFFRCHRRLFRLNSGFGDEDNWFIDFLFFFAFFIVVHQKTRNHFYILRVWYFLPLTHLHVFFISRNINYSHIYDVRDNCFFLFNIYFTSWPPPRRCFCFLFVCSWSNMLKQNIPVLDFFFCTKIKKKK